MALVKDFMNRKVYSVDCEDSALDAARLMKNAGVSCIIVTRNEKPAGIITEKDLVRRVLCDGRDPQKTAAESVMSAPLITVSPLMTLDEAADVLARGNIKKLGVLSGSRLEGIITATDLLAAETREMKMLERYVGLLSR